MTEISILLVGSTDRSEFREARTALDASGRVVAAADADSACSALQRGHVAPDVIVLAQASMAHLAEALSQDLGIPVLESPSTCVEALATSLED